MKSAIIYYSYSGNTRKVAETLSEYLRPDGEVDMIGLECLDESNTFVGQCMRAFKYTKGSIAPVNFDLSGYDLLLFGTPVWAFGPAPAMNTYLDKCSGVKGKDTILFATYGSGAGKGRCVDHMQRVLAGKGAGGFRRFFVQQDQADNKELIRSFVGKSRKDA
jgi:flavodoxin